jgi:hypothetical protein
MPRKRKVSNEWFQTDKKGLALLRHSESKVAVLWELLQNALDTSTEKVEITLLLQQGDVYQLKVRDYDPIGYVTPEHAYTLFAESIKKDDPTKRGRFNLGEKLAFAVAVNGYIKTTSGSIYFEEDGRYASENKTEVGSEVVLNIKMTAKDVEEIRQAMNRVIIPENRTVYYNNEIVRHKTLDRVVEGSLPTVIGGAGEPMRNTVRKTTVELYQPLGVDGGWLYEMGIPIVRTGDSWDYNVMQKVPLTLDRTNVSPTYLRKLREVVFNSCYDCIDTHNVKEEWVQVGSENPDAPVEALKIFVKASFGENAVVFDPSDPEANKNAMADGATIVHGRNLSREQWDNIRKHELITPAGKVYKSNTAVLNEFFSDSPNARPINEIPRDKWSEGMSFTEGLCKMLGRELLGAEIGVKFVNEITLPAAAYFGGNSITFNVTRLGRAFFEQPVSVKVLDLIVHEYGHYYASDHLSSGYYEALSKLAGKLAMLALERPSLFEPYRAKVM